MAEASNRYEKVLYRNLLTTPEVERLLQALSGSIASIQRAAMDKEASDDRLDSDWAVSEASVIDDLLGVAFVICQLYLNAVVTSLIFLHRYHARQSEVAETRRIRRFVRRMMQKCRPARRRVVPKLGRLKGERSKLLQCGSPAIKKGVPYTLTTAIDALANYFKHRDEWPNRWDDLEPSQRHCAKILRSVGLLDGKGKKGNLVVTGSFRDIFRQIVGHDDYENVGQLAVVLDNWRDALRAEYQEEFKSLGITA